MRKPLQMIMLLMFVIFLSACSPILTDAQNSEEKEKPAPASKTAGASPSAGPAVSPVDTEKSVQVNLDDDRKAIVAYIKNLPENHFLRKYKLGENFVLIDTDTSFHVYGAGLYDCTWEGDFNGGKERTLSFLVKGPQVFEIFASYSKKYELDFDNDGDKELILFEEMGSGVSFDSFSVIENGSEPVYHAAYLFVWPDEQQADGEFTVRIQARPVKGIMQPECRGKLAYRLVNGKKELYVMPDIEGYVL